MGLPRLTAPIIDRPAHNDGVGDVLIDLGEQRGRVPSDTEAPRDRPPAFRAVLFTLSTVLLVGLGGGVARPSPAGPITVPARLGDSMFVEQSRLYIVSADPEPRSTARSSKIISTYALPAGELLSRTTVAVAGAIFQVTAVGGTTLVSYQVDRVGADAPDSEEATVAVATGTDRVRWQAPARVFSASPADGLVLLRESSPWYGDQRWHGVDLTTGRTRWSLPQPLPVFTTATGYLDGFPRRLLTATTAGHLEVRDTVTGALLAQGDVPARPGSSRRAITVWPIGDLVLVGGLGGITAYTLTSLVPRWHSTVELAGHRVQACLDAICVFGYRGGVQVLDPGTGRLRWAAEGWTTAASAGSYLLVNSDERLEGRYPLVVVEPGTGVVHGDFGAWRSAGPARADGTLVGVRQRLGDDLVFYALLDPAALTVRLLGTATMVSGDCRATTDVLVCRRIDATVAIWPLTEL